jgi:DNA-binding response OmpR family regulator
VSIVTGLRQEAPRSILIVEDEFFLAMDMADALRLAGFRIIGLATSVDHALEIVAGEKPDLAVLDVSLGRERVTPVALLLRSLGVPFVLTTAWTQQELDQHEVLVGAANLGKPTNMARLAEVLHKLVP